MIKASEIIYKIRAKHNISLKYKTEPGLGKGGFKCEMWEEVGEFMGHRCYLKLRAQHVHSVGPFKNWVECSVVIAFYPTESNYKFNEDGYSYHCKYKKYFWGNYYTSDFDALLNKLFDTMCNHFDYHDGIYSKEDGDETMTLALYMDLHEDSVLL